MNPLNILGSFVSHAGIVEKLFAFLETHVEDIDHGIRILESGLNHLRRLKAIRDGATTTTATETATTTAASAQ